MIQNIEMNFLAWKKDARTGYAKKKKSSVFKFFCLYYKFTFHPYFLQLSNACVTVTGVGLNSNNVLNLFYRKITGVRRV